MKTNISFDVTAADSALIHAIVDRAVALAKKHGGKLDRLSTTMDLVATHLNGCPLDLAKFAAAPDDVIIHDVFGIARHLDRSTGRLGDCFDPKCSLPETAAVR